MGGLENRRVAATLSEEKGRAIFQCCFGGRPFVFDPDWGISYTDVTPFTPFYLY